MHEMSQIQVLKILMPKLRNMKEEPSKYSKITRHFPEIILYTVFVGNFIENIAQTVLDYIE